MKLHVKRVGEGPPLVILHGVFGSGDNWMTIAKALADQYTCLLVDQRNHGHSPHDPYFSYTDMANDLLETLDDAGYDEVRLMGHSMGGKTAMHFACLYPERTNRLVVVDIAPKAYAPHHDEIFDGFRSLDLATIQSRRQAEQAMAQVIANEGVRLFILKNLSRTSEGFGWKLNLDAIEAHADQIGAALPSDWTYAGPTLFIGGSLSDYILDEDHQDIISHFPEAQRVMLKGAGHWVHADAPEALLSTLKVFLP